MKLLGYFVLLIVLGALGYSVYVLAPRLQEVPVAGGSGVLVTMESEYEYTDTHSINVQYPQFGIPAVDSLIKEKLDSAIATFKAYPTNPPESSVPRNEFTSDVLSTYVGPDVISVGLVVSEYTGGAHPNSTILGINVDRTTEKELTLDDALRLIGKSLQEVADESLAKLNAELGPDVLFAEGASATAENYSTFLIAADSVTFVFQNYQVAAYAAGPQEVSFPRE
jgi:hypothetical protein